MQIIVNIIHSFFLILILGKAFSISYSSAGFFNLFLAAIITLAAYMVFYFYIELEFNLFIAIFFSFIGCGIISMISEIMIFKPLRKKMPNPMTLMLASLGLYIMLQNIISLIWRDDTKSLLTGNINVGNNWGGIYITNVQIITIFVCTALFFISLFFIKYHRIGRNIRAVSNDTELCDILGINSDKIILWACIIASILFATAGILIAFDVNMIPTMGFNWLLYGIVAMIIGGIGSNWGLVGGALLLVVSQHLVAYYIGSQWMDAIAYVILILFLIWKPLGFSGKRLKKAEI